MKVSFEAGRRDRDRSAATIADGIAVRVPVPYALDTMKATVDEVIWRSPTRRSSPRCGSRTRSSGSSWSRRERQGSPRCWHHPAALRRSRRRHDLLRRQPRRRAKFGLATASLSTPAERERPMPDRRGTPEPARRDQLGQSRPRARSGGRGRHRGLLRRVAGPARLRGDAGGGHAGPPLDRRRHARHRRRTLADVQRAYRYGDAAGL